MKTGNVVRAPQIHKSNEPILNHMNERHQRLSQMVHLKEHVHSTDYIGFL